MHYCTQMIKIHKQIKFRIQYLNEIVEKCFLNFVSPLLLVIRNSLESFHHDLVRGGQTNLVSSHWDTQIEPLEQTLYDNESANLRNILIIVH